MTTKFTSASITLSLLALLSAAMMIGCEADTERERMEHGPGLDSANATVGNPPSGDVVYVDVRLSDATIDLTGAVTAGPQSFRITNAGSHGQRFRVEGNGAVKELETEIQPSETRVMQLNLTPGSYTLSTSRAGDGKGVTTTIDVAAK